MDRTKKWDRPVSFAAKQALSPGEASPTGVLQEKVLALLAKIAQDALYTDLKTHQETGHFSVPFPAENSI